MPKDFWFWTAVPLGSTLEISVSSDPGVAASAKLQATTAGGEVTTGQLSDADLRDGGTMLPVGPPKRLSVLVVLTYASAGTATVRARVVRPDGTPLTPPFEEDFSGDPSGPLHAFIGAVAAA